MGQQSQTVTNPPTWFVLAFQTGMQRMFVAALPGRPRDQAGLNECVGEWVRLFWPAKVWDFELDSYRIVHAFEYCERKFSSWPSPARFEKALGNTPRGVKRVGDGH